VVRNLALIPAHFNDNHAARNARYRTQPPQVYGKQQSFAPRFANGENHKTERRALTWIRSLPCCNLWRRKYAQKWRTSHYHEATESEKPDALEKPRQMDITPRKPINRQTPTR